MISKRFNKKSFRWSLLVLIVLIGPDVGFATESRSYPKTIDVLTELYAKGVTSWQQYKAYEWHAREEGYQGLASMFAAMAASQSVIADRFGRLLVDLGAFQPRCFSQPSTVSGTQTNLKVAIEMEFLETDVTFPRALRHLAGEGYSKAVQSLQLVIEAQRHHRKKLQKIYPYTGHFFGAFTSKIKKLKPTYFICRQTGTVILNTLPANCPVQGGATTAYIELVKFETPHMVNACKWKNGYKTAG